jgi:GLPGLI family protein
MKLSLNNIICIIFIFINLKTNGQETKSTVNYKVRCEVNPEFKNTEFALEGQKAFNKLEYILIFNKNKSIYKPIDKMDTPDEDGNQYLQFAKIISGKFFFKDLINKEKIETIDEYNIIKDFNEYSWIISGENKIIDGYKCYKATTVKVDKNILKNSENTFMPFVWFAPEIPVPFGPNGLDGLPGLVLEGTFNGRVFFYATTINFISKSNFKLEKPKNGIYLTESEYNKVAYKNLQNLTGN